MAAADLDTPLGKTDNRKGLKLPVPAPQLVAGLLGLSVVIVGLWTVFADDPFGGEPIAIVATRSNILANAKDQNVAAAAAQGNERPSRYDGPDAAVTKKSGPEATVANATAIPLGSKVVTITDGSSGKSQQVVLPGKTDARQQQKIAIDQRLLETSRHGAIPKIGPDGARASAFYARPVKLPPGKADAPQISIIVGGLGVGAAATAEALDKLPATVTLAFAPYAADLDTLAARARGADHEVLLQAPMEPFDYPDNDPGPQTLLTSLTADQNIDRMHWLMSRMQGYVGVVSFMGTRFTASDQALAPVLRDVARRGLIFVDNGASGKSVAGQIAGSNNLPFAKADIVLDATPTPAEIDRALARLEIAARDKGSAVGIASASAASVARIAEWTKKIEARGFVLVPISMVALKAKSS